MQNNIPFVTQLGNPANTGEENKEILNTAVQAMNQVLINALRNIHSADMPFFVACIEQYANLARSKMTADENHLADTLIKNTSMFTVSFKPKDIISSLEAGETEVC